MKKNLTFLPLFVLALVSTSLANPTLEPSANFIEVNPTTEIQEGQQPSLWTLLTDLVQNVVQAFQDFFYMGLRAERSGQAAYNQPLFTIPMIDKKVTRQDVEVFLYDALVVAKKFYPSQNDEF